MKDFNKIEKALDSLPDSKKQLAKKLLSKAVFMDAELEKLQTILEQKGWVEEYKNGENQYGQKKASEGEVYNTLIKSYNSTMKQLYEMINSVVSTEESDGFLEFVGGKKTVVR